MVVVWLTPRRARGVAFAAMLSVAVAGASCKKRRGSTIGGQIQALIMASDAAWDDRARRGLDAVESPLIEAYALSAQHPAVLWRLSRVHVYRGLAEPTARAATSEFGAARELAIDCLDADAAFATRRRERGWPLALAGVQQNRASCVVWLRFSWARWMAALGPGAATIDLAAVDALGSYGRGGPHDAIVRWGDGLMLAIRPAWSGQDLDEAAKTLEALTERDPNNLPLRLDLLALVEEPRGSLAGVMAQREAITSARVIYPEDDVARRRLVGDEAP